MTFLEALSKQAELIAQVGPKLAHLTMGVGLFLEEADLIALAADGITEDPKDKKIDFMVNDEDSGRLVFAQGFVGDTPKDKAPANKASDLNTAAAWLVSGDEDKLPEKLKDKIVKFRDSLKEGKIQEIDLLYVHNRPESINVEEELITVAKHLENHLKEFGVQVRYHEIGSSKLDHLYSSQSSFIDVTEDVALPSDLGIHQVGEKWSGAVATVPGDWVEALYAKYGDRLYSANYRGFLGIMRRRGVNAGIRSTIETRPMDFWAFNNGITVLTRKIKEDKSGISLEGISVINGAQTSGTIGNCSDLGKSKDVSLLCRIIESNDEETISKIVRYNNTQNAITSWDQYANDDQQNRLDGEFAELGISYLKKRGFAVEGEQITIDAVFQPVLAFHARSRDAVRGKSQLFENLALYENAFSNTKARHILLAFCLSRSIDHIRLKLKAEEESGKLISFNEKQLRLLKNLNFKPFLIDVMAGLLELVRQKQTDRKTVAFDPNVAKSEKLAGLIEKCIPVVEAILPLVSIQVEADTFFRLHSEDDAFIRGVIDNTGATMVAAGIVAQLAPFSAVLADN